MLFHLRSGSFTCTTYAGTVGQNDVWELLAALEGAVVHEPQGLGVVGLLKAMGHSKPARGPSRDDKGYS